MITILWMGVSPFLRRAYHLAMTSTYCLNIVDIEIAHLLSIIVGPEFQTVPLIFLQALKPLVKNLHIFTLINYCVKFVFISLFKK